MLRAIIKLLRPSHYLKNGLIFIAIFFTKNLFDINFFISVLFGFIAFSLASSAVYIINDIKDVKADRQHEKKKNRPIASGTISIPIALGLVVTLLIGAVLFHLGILGAPKGSLVYLILYVLLNIGYSFGLKQIPILDIVILVSGFLIRVLYGAAIILAPISNWVYLTVIAFSFYLGLGKRRNEMIKMNGESQTRSVLKFYTKSFLDKNMYMSMSLAIVFYSLWSTDSNILIKYQTQNLVWTVPLVIILAMKYSLDVEKDSSGDPIEVMLGDKMLIVIFGLYILLLLGIVYGPIG